MRIIDTRIIIGLDPRPRRVYGLLADPAFGITMGTFKSPHSCFFEALDDEIKTWEPLVSGYDFILAICPDDPLWPADAVPRLKEKFALSIQPG